MSYDPTKRDSTWTEVQPGCFVDPAGVAHIFPDEILAFLSAMHPEAGFNPNDPQDYAMVVETYKAAMRKINPAIMVRVVKHSRVEN
jgi:hypothetical protein